MTMNKSIFLEADFLDQKDHDYLAELFYDFLADKGIFPQSIADFRIEIDYLPQDIDE